VLLFLSFAILRTIDIEIEKLALELVKAVEREVFSLDKRDEAFASWED